MNQVMEITGSFLYAVLSVVLMPVFILFDLVMGAWLLARWTRKQTRLLSFRFSHKQQQYALPLKKAVVLRAKLNNTLN